MIQQVRLLFITSLFFIFGAVNAQQEQDTIKRIEVFGIRAGVDISKPIISMINSDYKGLEIVADARVYKKFYAAVEFGYDENTIDEDYLNFSVNGSYFKFGVNYNAYENWVGMTNEIYTGLRYGFSSFESKVNSYAPNIYGTYFEGEWVEPGDTFTDQSIQWVEFVLGIKAETLKNLYLGFSLSFKLTTSNSSPDNFKNMYAPGFYRISLNDTGFGFNYTISYLIPYAKKNK